VAAVDKIKEKRKPEDFVGHRNSKTDIGIRSWLFSRKASPTRGAIESLENLVFSRLFLIFRWFCMSEPTIFLEVKIRRFLLHYTFGTEFFRTEPQNF